MKKSGMDLRGGIWSVRGGAPFCRSGGDRMRTAAVLFFAVCTLFLGMMFGAPQNAYASPGDEAIEPQANERTLTLVHTNDVHSNASVFPYVKGLVDSLEGQGKTVLTISAGDDFAGTSFASLSKGQDVATAMKMVGYDYVTLGNHEYMMNRSDFVSCMDSSDFQVLACNVPQEVSNVVPGIEGYDIVEIDGVKVALIGISYSWTNAPELLLSVTQAKEAAANEGAKVFVGISHLGLNPDDANNNAQYIADNCPWFTAIIDGHSHTILENGMRQNGVLIAQTGEYGNNIGVTEITIEVGSDSIVTATASSHLIKVKGNEENCGIVPDAAVKSFVDSVYERNSAYMNEIVLSLPTQFYGVRDYSRTQETNLGNLTTDAMREATGADIVLYIGPYMRINLEAGNVTRGKLEEALYANTELYTVSLTGEQILTHIETGLTSYPGENNAFPHLSGVRVRFDTLREAEDRVVSAILADGSSLDPHATYTCAIRGDLLSKYLGAGDHIEGVDYFTGYGTLLDAVIEYVNDGNNEITGEIDERMQPLPNNYTLSFDANGGEGSKDNQELFFTDSVVLPGSEFVRTGYRLVGWVDEEGNVYEVGATVSRLDTLRTGEVTLFAQWEQRTPVITIDKTSYLPGETVTISGTDFEPGSSVTATMYSNPIKVGDYIVGNDGVLTASFVIPSGVEAGAHTLVIGNDFQTAQVVFNVGDGSGGKSDQVNGLSGKDPRLAKTSDATIYYGGAFLAFAGFAVVLARIARARMTRK